MGAGRGLDKLAQVAPIHGTRPGILELDSVVFIAYVDESGTDDSSPCIGVGGLIADARAWDRFGVSWESALTEAAVPYSHMREFAHGVGAFKKWKSDTKQSEPERRRFLAALCDCISQTAVYTFGAVITKSHYEQHVPEEMRKDMGTPYTFLGRYCLARVGVWADNHGHNDPVDIVFERGQPQAAIRLQHGILAAHELVRQEFRIGALSFAEKYSDHSSRTSVLQLQAADLVAYELVKHWNDRASGRSSNPRYPLRRLMGMEHDWNKITAVDIAREVGVWMSIRSLAPTQHRA